MRNQEKRFFQNAALFGAECAGVFIEIPAHFLQRSALLHFFHEAFPVDDVPYVDGFSYDAFRVFGGNLECQLAAFFSL